MSPHLPPPDPAGPPAATLRAFVDGLVRGGVREAVVCPGSRSTPLALALAADPRVRLLTHVDERAGSFVALGLAKTARRPVVFAMTSGTAAVNAHPAVVEARYGRVPLIVLTADRPPELRGRSAPQTIDQIDLYGSAARLFVDMPVPEAGAAAEASWRAAAARATSVASGAAGSPPGPVHVNLPFREPLVPVGDLGPGPSAAAGAAGAPPTAAAAGDDAAAAAAAADRTVPPVRQAPERDLVAIAAILANASRPLVLAGPSDAPGLPAAVAALAAAIDAPVLADPLSGLRHGPHDRSRVLDRGDLLVRRGEWLDAHAPGIVIRFGGVPTSKPVALMLEAFRPRLFVVDDGDEWPEPGPCPAVVFGADPVATAEDLSARVTAIREATCSAGSRPTAPEPGWSAAWMSADRVAADAVEAALRSIDEPYEGRVFQALGDALPGDALVWLGSSMPVRDADTYMAGRALPLRTLANRGANGIDGVVSSAIGAAAASPGPVVVVVGDLTFLHDLNALVGARLNGIGLTIVVIDNDGGGIFSFLPQAATDAPGAGLPDRFERLFGVAHGTGAGMLSIAEALGARAVDLAAPARTAEEDQEAIRAALGTAVASSGVTVIRYATGRARNLELHREVAARVREALAPLASAALGPGGPGLAAASAAAPRPGEGVR